MERKKVELADVHRKIGQEKEERTRAIQEVRRQRETFDYEYGLKIKDLKSEIDSLNEQNVQLESELEGQLNENGERQREFGQVIFSIRGLYLSIAG
jgi:phage host-nuclease inhibitor protein Gam